MNRLIQRNALLTIVLSAGLSGAALACPPEEEGSPQPAQQQIEMTVRNGKQVTTRSLAPRVAGVTLAEPQYDYVVTGDAQQGSTLQTRVYKNGEAMKLYGLRAMGDGSSYTLRVKENGRDIRVEQHGDKVTATIDGKAVPADAVTVKDGKVEVRDASGATLLKEEWPEVRGSAHLFRSMPAVAPTAPVPPVPPGVTWPGSTDEAPKVMLGITMEDAEENVIEQLGLPEGEYVVINTAPEGLPAAKAGLQPKDILITVDGKPAAGTEAVRDIIREKNPGDTLPLEVMRKGNRIKLNVKLEAMDVKKFMPLAQTVMPGQNAEAWKMYVEKMRSMADQARKDASAHGDFNIAVPRDGKDPIILRHPGDGVEKLEERLNQMEAQLQRLEEMLRRMESRSASPAPASGGGGGGGGNPAPCSPQFASGL